MATGNFYYQNVLFVPCFVSDPEMDPDLFDMERGFRKESLQEYLDEQKIDYRRLDEYDRQAPRSFEGTVLAQINISQETEDNWDIEDITIEIVQYNGYYDGVNIDYRISHDMEDLSDQVLLQVNDQIKKIIEALSKCCDDYGVTARFSNGETIYHKRSTTL